MAEADTTTDSTSGTDRSFEDLHSNHKRAIEAFFKNPETKLSHLSEELGHDGSYISSLRSKKEWAFHERLEQLLEDPEIDNSEIRTDVWDGSRKKQGDSDADADTTETPADTEDEPMDTTENDPDVADGDFDPRQAALEDRDHAESTTVETIKAGSLDEHDDLEEGLDVAIESVVETIQSGEIDDPEQERLLLDNYRVLIDLVDAKRSLASPTIGDMG